MFRWLSSRVFWGVLLIAGGLVFLLQNFGLFEFGGLFWAFLLGLGGVAFVSVFAENRMHWWGLIPGITLLSVALLVFLGVVLPGVAGEVGGSLVLGGVGLSFLAVYLADRNNWWAVIPMGVLFTLAAIVALDELFGLETGGLLFLGLGLTFVAVAYLPTPQGRMTWAWIPGGILLVFGALLLAASESLFAYIWPAVLILGGILLILRTFTRARE